jgi:protein O-GlcNAc transferase
LLADPNYKPASENLAVVLTDLGTSLKLTGNVQDGLAKYYEALKADSQYANWHEISVNVKETNTFLH